MKTTLSPGTVYSKQAYTIPPTHCYRNKTSIIIEGSYEECVDAMSWHQWAGFYIDTVPTI